MLRLRWFSLVVLLLLVVTACPSSTTDRDKIPPTVVSSTPTNNATNIWVRDPIQVVFSEAVKATTINDTSITLTATGGIKVNKTLTLSNDDKTLRITIAAGSSLAVPTTLTCTLSDSITDLAGNPLAATGWKWQLPDWLQLGGFLNVNTNQDAYGPSLVLDASGNPVVAWYETQGSSYNIYVKHWDGTAWQPLGGALNAVAGSTGAFSPSLALGSTGKPVVAWYESDGIADNIYIKRWDGTAWQVVGGALSAVGGASDAWNPSLVLDASGNPLVAWSEWPRPRDIHVWRWDGTAWGPVGGEVDMAPDDLDSYLPALALDDGGNPLVVWNSSNRLYLKHWSGGTWQALGANFNVTPAGSGWAPAPKLALEAGGKPVVAWHEDNDGNDNTYSDNIYVKRWTGSEWQAVGGSPDVNAGTIARFPNLALDSSDQPVLAWSECASVGFSCPDSDLYVKHWNGSTWLEYGSGGPLNTFTAPLVPSLALDSSNAPVVAWSDYDGSFFNLYVKRWNGLP